ncbi:MAG: DUF2170 family protein [Thiotrichales bacterium]|nr:DUF2170 family protein [Thiotrichales bacterium]
MKQLDTLAFDINQGSSGAVTFDAALTESGDVIEVVCSNNPDASIFITCTDEQLLTVTNLFKTGDIDEAKLDELHRVMLGLNPVIPLSSFATMGDDYVLFGAMAVDTTLSNLCHELKTQANNATDVLAELHEYLIS